ncbi:hypothetical protein ACIHFC_34410 [Streptomyces sp. NPDC052013]|uniref:hypothetical protein n=1 Tax=Streptomyces sp. NPDC052013 TaxID=3365679 RepID=UPI0037D5F368
MLAVEVDDIGASVRFTTVAINGKRPAPKGQAGDDPWAATNPAATGGGSAVEGAEPPF